MSAEIEHFRIRKGIGIQEGETSVSPGCEESIDFFSPMIQLLVSCDISSLSSTITLFNNTNRIFRSVQARIYEGAEDNKGKRARFEDGKVREKSF